ncbi:hypothetical protein FFK22_024560 [Mycobacterium sp. KBS0706]|uniref:hypothetical protein n=1 Tax=Mycobacterium sp. KBS0706 TaxID=2578109 RepID=UPI00110F8823|nr:hypothetical protein [Mycobacterium sp. KBS0706]TSD85996.1 hypothetical protein FFK22_024560 [Mycobacterium sp. KBS0706]
MNTGLLILGVWLAGLSGLVGGLAWHAYWLHGVRVITRQFIAETLILIALLSIVLYGPHFVGLGTPN